MNIIFVDVLGYVAAGIVFLTFCMKTMLALRLIAIASNVAFILYAVAAGLTPILLLHGLLLPLNVIRLIEMQRLVRVARDAETKAPGEERFDWLIPLGRKRTLPDGAALFRKGDAAESLFIVVSGAVSLPEIGVTLGPGAMLGEIGVFAADRRRTTSAVAIGPLKISELTERRARELYFDNPGFSYKLVRMITRRLVEDIARFERRPDGATALPDEPV